MIDDLTNTCDLAPLEERYQFELVVRRAMPDSRRPPGVIMHPQVWKELTGIMDELGWRYPKP